MRGTSSVAATKLAELGKKPAGSMYLQPPSVQRLDYTMTWYTATQTNGEVSLTSTKRLNPNALPFSPILKANVFTFSPVTSPDSGAWMNGAATSTFPTSTTRLNPNALPFSPDQKTNAFSPVILPEAGATPTFPTSTARLNSNALPFWPRKAFTSGPTSPVPSFASASESPKTHSAEWASPLML
ncbi:hypothetical protein M405DRAFT_598373 [Rhizopogon salebrosus TDB-379]|nr:hypothetical protein M405DRAFT_598373 [Rhizopogon salebrosus TDB-379]